MTNRIPGYYWVQFTWGIEPARWDGSDWLRFGIEQIWNNDVVSIGEEITQEKILGESSNGK